MLFRSGPLDQGFWPDGIYVAPTDNALRADIEKIKAVGFNMVRKHIKVEPARWYYWADKLGLLVWQDMPSANSYTGNPLACRAALATLAILEEEGVLEANRARASVLTQKSRKIASHPRVRHFRNTGMIWAFDVRDAKPDFSQDFFRRALEEGVLLRPLGDTVYWMPPYVTAEGEIDFLVTALERLLGVA